MYNFYTPREVAPVNVRLVYNTINPNVACALDLAALYSPASKGILHTKGVAWSSI